jgi:hypothetical protein
MTFSTEPLPYGRGSVGRAIPSRARKQALCASVLLALLIPALPAASAKRIHFQRGHTSAEVTGRFTPKETESFFVIHGHTGQHMKVEIKPLTPDLITAGTVTAPSGKSDGGPGGVIYDSDLTETGDYSIRVFERQQNLAGRFAVHVDLK